MSLVKTSDNHARAPLCSEFVRGMREVFGEVKVLHVKEGDFELGEKQPEGTPCFHDGKGVAFPYIQKKAA